MSTEQKVIQKQPDLPPALQAAIALLLPLTAGLVVGALLGSGAGSDLAVLAPVFATIGLASWLLGLFWYGLRKLGLRGGRPLFSGIAFASLGWLALLPLRFVFVELIGFGGGFNIFIFLLLFEGFAVHLWLFGLLFRAVALWRGALTAAISSGIVFGAVAVTFFQEATSSGLISIIYFVLWGIFYGVIRLRTGSIWGLVLVQATQSFTTWTVLLAPEMPDPTQMQSLHLATSIALIVFIWRLWPKEVEDYRV